MCYNICYVQDLESVKKQFEELGPDLFKDLYEKRTTLIGPEDSIKFINEKLSEFN